MPTMPAMLTPRSRERGGHPGERTRPIVELDREPDRHAGTSCRGRWYPAMPRGGRARSLRSRHATGPRRAAPERPDLRPRLGPGDPRGDPLLQGAADRDPPGRPDAASRSRAGELRRFVERLGARGARSTTTASVSRRRSRLPADGRRARSSSGCSPTRGCCGCRWSGSATTSPPAGPRRPGRPGSGRRRRRVSDDGQRCTRREGARQRLQHLHPGPDGLLAGRHGPAAAAARRGDDHELLPSTTTPSA